MRKADQDLHSDNTGPSATGSAEQPDHTAVEIEPLEREEAQDHVGDLPPMNGGASRRASMEYANGHGAPNLVQRSADAIIREDPKWVTDQDLEKQQKTLDKKNKGWKNTLWLGYLSLGIVYGDIGTSPLYAFNNIFIELNNGGLSPSKDDILGATSLVIWTIILIVMIKYGCIVMFADDNSEGGTFALFSLLSRFARLDTPGRTFHESDLQLAQYDTSRSFSGRRNTPPVAQGPWVPPNKTARLLHNNRSLSLLVLLVVLGATAMVIGDGILTPAQSVLAAISGLGTQNSFHNIHLSQPVIVGISCAVLAFLYLFQFVGTKYLGWAFSPVVVAWLLFNMIIGIYNIVHWHPAVFAAISPHYSFKFLIDHHHQGWVMLGAVVLCVTGAEAMYADLGHFTRPAIQLGLFSFLLPSLLFTYLGQAAYLIRFPSASHSVYYNSLPHPIYWPMFVVATLASIVASQAMITAAFSIIRQSMTLGCFPRLKIVHTNNKIRGQIYIPEINYTLMVLSIAAVGGFQTIDRIGSAYGVAVTFVFFITDILFTLVMLAVWEIHWAFALSFFVFFGALDGVYLSATLNKFTHGGWFPVAVAAVIFIISGIWAWGQQYRKWFLEGNDQKPLYEFLSTDPPTEDDLKNPATMRSYMAGMNESRISLRRSSVTGLKEGISRIPGVGFCHAESIQGVPPVFEHLLNNLPAMYDYCVFITVREVAVPYVDDSEKYLITELEYKGFYRCVCRFGYMECVNLGEDFERDLLKEIGKLTEPEGDWAPFNASLRHKMATGLIRQAKDTKAVYIMGRVDMKSTNKLNLLQKLVLNYFYLPIERNCRSQTENWSVPRSRLIEVGMTHEVGTGEHGDPFWEALTNGRKDA